MNPPALPAASLDWCLFLDVDGTLLELTETPTATVVDPQLKSLLAEVAERLGGAVALVSGRSIAYLDALFAPLQLPSAGLHGVERRKASGAIQGASYIDAQLNAARTALANFVAAHPGTLLEDKDRSLAVHYRMAPAAEPAVRQAVAAGGEAHGNELSHPGGQHGARDQAVRIYQGHRRQGVHARTAVLGPNYRSSSVMISTDEGGFRAVEVFGGISIAVGDRVHGHWRVDNPSEVRRWLESIAALTDSHHA